jgi:ElaB/YqjD/DUF883 family membrane-anchored ribosome-binding protein
MNPTEAKFQDDLEKIATDLNLAVSRGKFCWADVKAKLKDRTDQLAHTTDCYVHENAWTSVAIACGTGLILGYLLKRR